MPEFFRSPTAQEQTQFKHLPVANQLDLSKNRVRKEIDKKANEYSIKYKPFCSRCAWQDFKDQIEEKIKEYQRYVKRSERAKGYADFDKFKIEIPDLEEYGNSDRFIHLKDQSAMEPIPGAYQGTQGQIIRQTKIGIHRDYECKIRGCGISVFIPNEVLNGSGNNTNNGDNTIREQPKKERQSSRNSSKINK